MQTRRQAFAIVAVVLSMVVLVRGQGPRELVLVIDRETPTAIAQALRHGAEAAASLPSSGITVAFATPEDLKGAGAHPQAAGIAMFTTNSRAAALRRLAETRKLPVVDLGEGSAGRRAGGAPGFRGDHAQEARAAAWWIFGPFAHHRLGLYHGSDARHRELAKVFEEHARKQHPRKQVEKMRRVPGRAEAAAREMERMLEDGVTAFFVCGEPEEGRIIAEAARTLAPPPVVVLASSALGFEPADRKDPSLPGPFPDGTVVMDLDLPGPEELKPWAGHEALVTASEPVGPWALAAFEGCLLLRAASGSASETPSGDGDLSPRPALPRPRLRDRDPRALCHHPSMVVEARLRPCVPQDPAKPRPRPLEAPFDLEEGVGPFSKWSTLIFQTHPDTTRCHFAWSDGKTRSIDQDLKTLLLHTSGRQPVIDHLVREKLMARLMSITGEKFGLTPDGRPVPGKSFRISMVARTDKTKAKQTWPVYVAGDDPEAGGRAFGSYCFVYSTFIVRTIFTQYELLDAPVGFGDLPVLTGLGEPDEPYITGTRRDVIYRLIDNYAGSMALTAAHEIGHLAGLGHDTDDPTGIMNVEEGAGIGYREGHFTPANEEMLEKTLGRVPEPRRR